MMSPNMNEYSESTLVEQPTIELFQSLGYEHQNCFHEKFGDNGTLARETPSDVVLLSRLKSALCRLNPELPEEAIALAIEELCRARSSQNPVIANRELYRMLKDGIKVSTRMEDGSEEIETVKVIDFDNPETNDFFLASQFWVTGEMYKRRADLVGFVNCLPLIFIELKATHKRLENAYRKKLADYKSTIPQMFWYNAFIILSNGSKSRIGTITSDWEHFSDWKRIGGEEGESPVKPKRELIKKLENSIPEIVSFCKEKGIDIHDIISSEKFVRIKMLDDAVDAILVNEESKRKYIALAASVNKLYGAILPDPEAVKFSELAALFKVITDKIRALSPEGDITEVRGNVEKLLDESIEAEGYVIKERQELYGTSRVNLRQIDFEALKRSFMREKKHIHAERLKHAVKEKVTNMVRLNRSRTNFLEKLQQMIDEYNSGAINVEIFFDKLLAFAKGLQDQHKCDLVYQHVYDAYYGLERSVYAAGA